jgi:tetratricopeptide (TPR) repeat protein
MSKNPSTNQAPQNTSSFIRESVAVESRFLRVGSGDDLQQKLDEIATPEPPAFVLGKVLRGIFDYALSFISPNKEVETSSNKAEKTPTAQKKQKQKEDQANEFSDYFEKNPKVAFVRTNATDLENHFVYKVLMEAVDYRRSTSYPDGIIPVAGRQKSGGYYTYPLNNVLSRVECQEANKKSNQALTENPNSVPDLLTRGRSYFQFALGQFGIWEYDDLNHLDKTKHFIKIPQGVRDSYGEIYPTGSYFLVNAAHRPMMKTLFNKAQDDIKHALTLEPSNPDLNFQMGLIYLFNGQNNKARNHFENAVKHNPEMPLAHYYLGLVEVKTAKAKKAFEEELKISPNNPYALEQLGLIAYHEKNYNKAVQHFESILAVNADTPIMAHLHLSKIYHDQGNYERELHHLKAESEQIIKQKYATMRYPVNPLKIRIAQAQLNLDRPEVALEVLQGLKPRHYEDFQEKHVKTIKAYIKLNREGEAESELKALMDLMQKEGRKNTFSVLGEVMQFRIELHGVDNVERDLNQAIAKHPDDSSLLVQRAAFLFEKSKQGEINPQQKIALKEEAIRDLTQAIENNPKQPSNYHVRGIIYQSLDNKDAAKENFAIADYKLFENRFAKELEALEKRHKVVIGNLETSRKGGNKDEIARAKEAIQNEEKSFQEKKEALLAKMEKKQQSMKLSSNKKDSSPSSQIRSTEKTAKPVNVAKSSQQVSSNSI